MSKFLTACIVMAGAAACAKQAPPASSPGPGATSQSQNAAASRNRDVITHEELQAQSIAGLSVLDAVKSLRPQFLTQRGTHNVPYSGNNGAVDQEAGKVHASIDGS